MNTVHSIPLFDMDAGLGEDRMDLASSPFRQADDLDLDFDTLREPSVDPMNADMIDEDLEQIEFANDAFQANDEQISPDDDMLDENGFDEDDQDKHGETDMDSVTNQGAEDAHRDEDGDILYEEEEDVSIPTLKADNEEINIEISEERGIEERPTTLENQEPVTISAEDLDNTHIDDNHNGKANIQEEILEGETYADVGNEDLGEVPLEPELDELDTHFERSAQFTNETGVIDIDNAENGPPSDNVQEPQDQSDPNFQDSEHVQKDAIANEEITDQRLPTSTHPEETGTEEKTDNDNSILSVPDSSLHLVKVVYLGEEMSLFPPSQEEETSTFFLSDSNLAFENLEKLLTACREILSGSIGHDDELVLDIQTLGLHVCEDSKYSSRITLSQIIETYLNLSRNEHIEEVQPLICVLSSRVCLASQYAYLSGAAQEGKTFTEVSADYLDSPLEDVAHTNEISDEDPVPAQIVTEAFTDRSNHVADEDKIDNEGHDFREKVSFVGLDNPVRDAQEDERIQIIDPDEYDHDDMVSEQVQDDQKYPDPGQELRSQFPTLSASNLANGHQKEELYDECPNNLNEEEPEVLEEETPKAPYNLSLEEETNVEEETDSSHTLQADLENNFHQDHVDPPLDEVDEEDGGTTVAVGEDHTPFSNDEQNPQDEFQQDTINDNDGLYQPQIDDDLSLGSQGIDDFGVPQDDHEQLLNQITEVIDLEIEPGPQKLEGDSDHANDKTQAGADTAPVTPMKGKNAKRKALDEEDEFNLLDTNTPEPKRRRPS